MRIPAAALIALALVAGCANKPVTEKEFQLVLNEYIKTEFVEGFDEKPSLHQREQMLKKIVGRYSIDLERFKSFARERHAGAYKTLFEE
ncbi:MAG TPA: hypothetical protein PKJ16_09535 [Spirochaetota bacterium]|nr:hypothetical protein [Spirochaetota bacterium]HOS39374.1 hypothetical protein [Spirochaetota bacterium]HPU86935.1 hypothetical protein [Spirochaetota bacterium]